MTTKSDSINFKILEDLLKDGRKPFAEIAKENNTSKDVIAKRYKQMKTKGIIVGSTIQNSPKCYGASFVATIQIHVQRGKLDNVVQAVNKIPNVRFAYPLVVQQKVLAEVLLKNIEELESVKKIIQSISFVHGTEVKIWTGKRDIPENLSIFKIEDSAGKKTVENNSKDAPAKKTGKLEIDDIDRAIIEKLALNGRMAFAEIAQPLKVSTETVVRRYEKLRQNGDLKVVVQIDPTKIGYYAFGFFELSFSQEALADNIEKISKTPDVNLIIKSAGYSDLTFTLMIRDINHFTEIQDQMVALPNITKIDVGIARMFCPWPENREIISSF